MTLTGGHVIDPAHSIDGPADVVIEDGRIVAVGTNLTKTTDPRIDVSGCYVTPGIVDIHTHVHVFDRTPAAYVSGVDADAHLFASGVTTTADAGTVGWEHFADFKTRWIDESAVRVLAFLNIARGGMIRKQSEQDVADLQPDLVAEMALAYPDEIVGIKSAHYWTRQPWDADHPPWASVERAVQAGERCGKPVMVDFWPRPPERSYESLILEKLRPGDIHTHVFAKQFPILTEDGEINPALLEARTRGVIFDLGHGAGSFMFRNALPALEKGFPPDSISTDLHRNNIAGTAISMQHVMSKYVAMGMPLYDVIERSTVAPSREIGREDLGTLAPGAEADVAVFRLRDGDFGYADCGGARLSATKRLECRLTVRAGRIVFNPDGLGMPEWTDAPAAYWQIPR